MNFAFSSSHLPELEQLVTTLFAENKCACHIINPHKTRILLWQEKKENQITYYLRIGIQKFVSSALLDRNGETYWRFENYAPELKKEAKPELNKDNPQLDPITKFQQRQAKAEQISQENELSTNNSTTVNSNFQPTN